jgi:hypothetical protein
VWITSLEGVLCTLTRIWDRNIEVQKFVEAAVDHIEKPNELRISTKRAGD